MVYDSAIAQHDDRSGPAGDDVNDEANDQPEPAPRVLSVRVADDKDGERLDRFLAAAIGDISRTRLQGFIGEGRVTGPAGPAVGPKHKVRAGEIYRVSIPATRDGVPAAQDLPLEILYEDADIIVLDKPAGIVVHPAPGHPDGTLVNALLAHCGPAFGAVGGAARPGIVHRLDIGTSGVMIAAKTESAYLALTRAFAAHDLERAYEAVVWGCPQPASGKIETRIGRSPRNRKKMAVLRHGGKPAATRYRVLHRAGEDFTLLRCTLETGRTHQIRVHMAHVGHPIVGDPTYGGNRTKTRLKAMIGDLADLIDRPLLHAVSLGIKHPKTGEFMTFSSSSPSIFNKLLSLFE